MSAAGRRIARMTLAPAAITVPQVTPPSTGPKVTAFHRPRRVWLTVIGTHPLTAISERPPRKSRIARRSETAMAGWPMSRPFPALTPGQRPCAHWTATSARSSAWSKTSRAAPKPALTSTSNTAPVTPASTPAQASCVPGAGKSSATPLKWPARPANSPGSYQSATPPFSSACPKAESRSSRYPTPGTPVKPQRRQTQAAKNPSLDHRPAVMQPMLQHEIVDHIGEFRCRRR